MAEDSNNLQIGDFHIQGLLRRRVAITMYRATQQSLRRLVLLKVISLSGISENHHQLVQAFQTYVGTIAALEHLHLQPIYGQGVMDEDHIYIAGRLIAGSLYELLEGGALPLEQALELALQTLSALNYLHSNGFIHKSLSPHNIYIGDDGNAYINDLELAPLVQAVRSLEELKALLDEPFYASVEQLQVRPLDVRSELYTFGAILYHMVTGVAPFSEGNDSFESVLERKLQEQVRPPRQLNPSISSEFEKIILRSLRSNPEERFTDASALERELRNLSWSVRQSTRRQSLLERARQWIARR